MAKKIRIITEILIFFAIGIILFTQISEILRRKTGESADMMHSFYSQTEKGGNIDVLCLGSSHGYFAVQSNYLWNEYGIASYVMCSPQQTVATSYYVLKEVLKYESPQVVLLETYMFYRDGKYVDSDSQVQVRKAFDGLKLDEVKIEMVEDFFGELDWKEKLSFYLPFLQYHSRWSSLESYDFVTQPYLRGSQLGYKVHAMETPEAVTEATDPGETNCAYFEKLQALCEENGISLVVFAAPYGYDEKNDSYFKKQGVNVALKSYLAEKEIPFLFYQEMDEVEFDYSTDFYDETHLNTAGGFVLSKHLGAWLQEQYGVPDHRGDAEYADWDEDYQKYLEAVAEAGGTAE